MARGDFAPVTGWLSAAALGYRRTSDVTLVTDRTRSFVLNKTSRLPERSTDSTRNHRLAVIDLCHSLASVGEGVFL
jgi:hypothetical protein